MTIVVKEKSVVYFVGDYTGGCLEVKKINDNKFYLLYNDRVEPIVIYQKLENIQYVMTQIISAIYNNKRIIYLPPRDKNFEKEDVQSD